MLFLLALLAVAGPIETVKADLDAGRTAVAQQACTAHGAQQPSADPALRDVCARAFWATTPDSSAAWAEYRRTWSGTRGEGPALEKEAAAALRELGSPTPAERAAFAERYAGTEAARAAAAVASGRPAVVTLVDGRPTSVTLASGHRIDVPVYDPFHTAGDGAPRGWIPAAAGPLLADGRVLAQEVSGLFLVLPVSGRLPYFTDAEPPASIAPVPMDQATREPPSGWRLGRPGADGADITGPGGETWRVPRGEVRFLPGAVQATTGLHDRNPALSVAGAPPIPDIGDREFWARKRGALVPLPPSGTRAVVLDQVFGAELANAAAMLTGAGVPVDLIRGWRFPLDADAPSEVVIEARHRNRPLLLLFDPMAGGRTRLWAIEPGRGFDVERGMPFAFDRDGLVYLSWIGLDADGAWIRSVHVDARGLDVEYTSTAR